MLRELWNKIYEFYLVVKYSLVAERAGFSRRSFPKKRGFIIIQIDALAYDYLVKALQWGYMPFLKRLLKRGEYKLSLWDCGLPSTTPAVQAGLLFGNSFDICGFRWYEKDTGLRVEGKNPQSIQAIQCRVAENNEGLLRGGSSYFSMLDGGASLSLFTLGAINRTHLFQSLRGTGVMVLFLLHPWRVIRVIGLSLWEYLRTNLRVALYSLIPSLRPEFNLVRPLGNILVNVVFREMQTYACLVDIYRGIPAIYTNYYGYDEIAHQTGTTSGEAFRVLKGIDKQIKQIVMMCSREGFKHYDIFILSDHGMAPSLPFKKAFGYTLGEFISANLGEETSMEEAREPEKPSETGIRMLLREVENVEGRVSRAGLRMIRFLKRMLMKHITFEEAPSPPESDDRVVVSCSGPLAHIYFTRYRRKLNLSEITRLYPGLVEKLVEHPGVGLVAAKEGNEVYVFSKKGSFALGEKGAKGDFTLLEPFGDPEILGQEIKRLASFPHSGDIIVFGALDSKRGVVTFEDQKATHGGLGGAQTRAFIIYPAYLPLRITPYTRAEDLYHFFKDYYRPSPKEAILEEEIAAIPATLQSGSPRYR